MPFINVPSSSQTTSPSAKSIIGRLVSGVAWRLRVWLLTIVYLDVYMLAWWRYKDMDKVNTNLKAKAPPTASAVAVRMVVFMLFSAAAITALSANNSFAPPLPQNIDSLVDKMKHELETRIDGVALTRIEAYLKDTQSNLLRQSKEYTDQAVASVAGPADAVTEEKLRKLEKEFQVVQQLVDRVREKLAIFDKLPSNLEKNSETLLLTNERVMGLSAEVEHLKAQQTAIHAELPQLVEQSIKNSQFNFVTYDEFKRKLEGTFDSTHNVVLEQQLQRLERQLQDIAAKASQSHPDNQLKLNPQDIVQAEKETIKEWIAETSEVMFHNLISKFKRELDEEKSSRQSEVLSRDAFMELYGRFLEDWMHSEIEKSIAHHQQQQQHHPHHDEHHTEFNVTTVEQLQALLQHYPTADKVSEMMEAMLELYSADQIAKTDYALASAGGAIVPWRTTPSYRRGSDSVWSGLWPSSPVGHAPSILLNPDNSMGNCWAFNGGQGHVTIRLSEPISITHVSLDHVSTKIAKHPQSAPRNFRVWGLHNETDTDVVLLGEFEYAINGPHVQTFPVTVEKDSMFSFVMLDVLTNYGHEYTCVYRFRVHGTPKP